MKRLFDDNGGAILDLDGLTIPMPGEAGAVQGYESQEAAARDMANPRYRSDEAFRQQVLERLKLSEPPAESYEITPPGRTITPRRPAPAKQHAVSMGTPSKLMRQIMTWRGDKKK